ncbi:MAG: gamma-glutamylcyclotransferase [Burkholderiaceae bacterium]|nr:gamma-glutamylcyclotransferase [Burkholderiaceae bacterium]
MFKSKSAILDAFQAQRIPLIEINPGGLPFRLANESPFDHPHAKHLHAKARCLGPARMPGILYQVTWYPGATDRLNHHANASESWVYGELWQLDTELLLTEIDRYEENILIVYY